MLQGWRKLRLWLCLRLRLRVVLFAIDVLRCRVLFPVDLLLLGGRQRFALGDAVLLIFSALPDFAVAVVRGIGVVLVLINLLGKLVLLSVDLLLLGRRQLAAVGCAVCLGFAVDGCFFRFQVSGFTGRQLAALHASRDAVLLIFFALRNRRLWLRRRSWRCL